MSPTRPGVSEICSSGNSSLCTNFFVAMLYFKFRTRKSCFIYKIMETNGDILELYGMVMVESFVIEISPT